MRTSLVFYLVLVRPATFVPSNPVAPYGKLMCLDDAKMQVTFQVYRSIS